MILTSVTVFRTFHISEQIHLHAHTCAFHLLLGFKRTDFRFGSGQNPRFRAVWELFRFALLMTELFDAVLSVVLDCWSIFFHMEK